MPVEIGQLLEDKYRVVRLIGAGGMGAVYEGENTKIKRRVAIKVLHALAASNPELVKRFEREAQAAGRIGNDHILEILDLGSLPDGDWFIVMEYLDGESLRGRLTRLGRLTPVQASVVAMQVLAGLHDAHRAQIVHRDLKPENIFILREKAGKPDFVKIIDFGISKFGAGASDIRMTQTGVVMGTPLYMSPEQASGLEADPRSDLYAVGVLLFEATSGAHPFAGVSYNELILKIVLTGCPPLAAAAPDVPPSFAAIVDKAVCRDPNGRFQSATEFADALGRWVGATAPSHETFGVAGARSEGTARTLEGPLGPGEGQRAVPSGVPTATSFEHTNSRRGTSRSRVGLWIAGLATAIAAAAGALTIMRAAPSGGIAEAPPEATSVVPSEVAAPAPSPAPPRAVDGKEDAKPFDPDEPVAKAYVMSMPSAVPAPSVKGTPAVLPPRAPVPKRPPGAPPPAPTEPRRESSPDLGY